MSKMPTELAPGFLVTIEPKLKRAKKARKTFLFVMSTVAAIVFFGVAFQAAVATKSYFVHPGAGYP